MATKRLQPESLIKQAICEYLSYQKECMFWINSSVGIYDPKRGIFRSANSKYQRTGVADILGVYQGKPLAIEVKAPKGVVSDSQKQFLCEFEKNGGIAIVARCINDVAIVFKSINAIKAGQ